MSIHALALSFIATLSPPTAPSDKDDHDDVEDVHFCCDWVDPNGNDGAGSGGGCVKTTEDNINGCANWLICPGGATGSDGVVNCTAPKKK